MGASRVLSVRRCRTTRNQPTPGSAGKTICVTRESWAGPNQPLGKQVRVAASDEWREIMDVVAANSTQAVPSSVTQAYTAGLLQHPPMWLTSFGAGVENVYLPKRILRAFPKGVDQIEKRRLDCVSGIVDLPV
jgi:hypothetical protein